MEAAAGQATEVQLHTDGLVLTYRADGETASLAGNSRRFVNVARRTVVAVAAADAHTVAIDCVAAVREGFFFPTLALQHVRYTVASPDSSDARAAEIRTHLGLPAKPLRLLVLVNPAGGTGAAEAIFATFVRPVFALAGVAATVVTTTHVGHAREVVAAAQLDAIDGIVTVSGDGTIHEVLNGLMARRDWRAAMAKPIGAVPGGSGNALAVSLGLRDAVAAAAAIARGGTTALDIMAVRQGPRRFFSFLTLTWAIASDVDIESEVVRWIGDVRFTLWGLYRIFFLRRYRGALSYLRTSDVAPPPSSSSSSSSSSAGSTLGDEEEGLSAPQQRFLDGSRDAWRRVDGIFTFLMASNMQYQNKDMRCTPRAALADGSIDLIFSQEISRWDMIRVFLGIEDGSHVDDVAALNSNYVKVKAFRLEVDAGDAAVGHLVVDGELVPYEPIEFENINAAWRAFQ